MAGNEDSDHDILYQQGREQIETNYLQAVNRGVVDPVVVVMDLREPLAMKIAEAAGQSAVIQAQIAESERRGVVPTVFGGYPREAAKKLLAESPEIVRALNDGAAPDMFSTIIIAHRATSVRETPTVE